MQPNLDSTHPKIQEDKLREIVVASAPSTNLIMIGWSIGLSSCLQSMVRAGISVEVMTSESSWLYLNALGRENLSQADVESLLRASFETAMVQQTQFGQCFMELEKKLRKALLR